MSLMILLLSQWAFGECQRTPFSGPVVATWGESNRVMTLVEPLVYTDPDCNAWPVPAGVDVDGASIPQLFWALIGSPFSGIYRKASVIHDHYCVEQNRPWQSVHRMFYDAMIDSGTNPRKAKVMYYAVLVGGPRWKYVHYTNHEPRAFSKPGDIDYEELEQWSILYDEQLAAEHVQALQTEDFTLEEIEALASRAFAGTEPPNSVRID